MSLLCLTPPVFPLIHLLREEPFVTHVNNLAAANYTASYHKYAKQENKTTKHPLNVA